MPTCIAVQPPGARRFGVGAFFVRGLSTCHAVGLAQAQSGYDANSADLSQYRHAVFASYKFMDKYMGAKIIKRRQWTVAQFNMVGSPAIRDIMKTEYRRNTIETIHIREIES